MEDYNPAKKRRMLTVFDDVIADMESNKKLIPIVTELFLRGGKLNIPCIQYSIPKTIRLNVTHCFIMKIPNKSEF